MKELENIRREIDSIDDKLVKLYVERLEKIKEVAKIKEITNTAVVDEQRESDILYRLTKNHSDDIKKYIEQLYSTIFSLSKAYQRSFLIKKSNKEE